jgi:uncharacterized membrane protein
MEINGYPLFYIFWNLFLGLIPFFLASQMFRLSRRRNLWSILGLAGLFVLWLAFMPNAPYIITDMRHINGFCPNTISDICVSNAWLIFFYFIYALFGWVLYYYALEQMIVFVDKYLNKVLAKLLPLILSPIIAVGLLLGLIDRLNSWDLVARPFLVIQRASNYISDPQQFRNYLVTTSSLILLFYCAKILFRPISWTEGIFKSVKK